ncbi:MAG: hypothetical protein AB2693_22360 [Candidatus Thiodiazotropha sp.]
MGSYSAYANNSATRRCSSFSWYHQTSLLAPEGSTLGVRPEGSALGVRPEASALGVHLDWRLSKGN